MPKTRKLKEDLTPLGDMLNDMKPTVDLVNQAAALLQRANTASALINEEPPPPDDFPVPTYFSRLVLYIQGKDRLYDLEIVHLKRMNLQGVEQLPTPKTVTVRGQEYAVDVDLAARLFGWFPGAKRSWWWTTYKDLILPRAVKQGLLVYREPDAHSAKPVMPLDRLADQRSYGTMTPHTNKAYTDSKLKARYLRSTPFGGILDSKVLLIVLLGLIAFVIIFMLSGGMR
jgi:hypothetical protein